MLKKISIFLLIFGFLYALDTGASQVTLKSGKTFDVSKGYEAILVVSGPFTYEASSVLNVSKAENVKEVLVVWSGKTKKGHLVERIRLQNGDYKTEIPALRKYIYEEGESLIYTAYGKMDLEDLKAGLEAASSNAEAHAFFGHTFIVVREDSGLRGNETVRGNDVKTIGVYVGLQNLRPGDMYHIQLPIQAKGILRKATVMGGGGLEGNGSSNMVNGVALSGGDDWNGSSGPKWDLDTYEDLEKYKFRVNEKLTWSIDPLLQWVFPAMFILEVKEVR